MPKKITKKNMLAKPFSIRLSVDIMKWVEDNSARLGIGKTTFIKMELYKLSQKK